MEFLQGSNKEMSALLQRVNLKKSEMEEEAAKLSNQSDKMIKNALIIGGALVVTFFVVRSLTGKSSKKNDKELNPQDSSDQEPAGSSMISEIGSRVAEAAVVFLLGLAKEQLSGYLKSRQKENENTK